MLCRYAKVQLSAYPSATSEVQFDDIVPKATSTRRVAAAAFYHCLGVFSSCGFLYSHVLISLAHSSLDQEPDERQAGQAVRSVKHSGKVIDRRR